jgi:hypothetical protein
MTDTEMLDWLEKHITPEMEDSRSVKLRCEQTEAGPVYRIGNYPSARALNLRSAIKIAAKAR